MNIDEAKEFLRGNPGQKRHKSELPRLRKFLNYWGDPDKNQNIMHIAGTNGKGSIASFSAYILAAAGFKVGQYSSPAVYRFGERIRILDGHNGNKKWAYDPAAGEISDEDILKYTEMIKAACEHFGLSYENQPNYFDMLTLISFLFFADNNCDFWIIETGLGGKLDATNVIYPPKVAVITAIGLDHTDRLGNTYREIASEKAGILKQGTQSLCLYDQYEAIENVKDAAEVSQLFTNRARDLGIKVRTLATNDVLVKQSDLNGQIFAINKAKYAGVEFKTNLLAEYEPLNAYLSIMAVEELVPDIDINAIKFGLSNCYWPARLEKINHSPLILLDGGHNPQGVRALRISLDRLLPAEAKEIHVYSAMSNKDHANSLREALRGGKVKFLICTRVHSSNRAMDPAKLAEIAQQVSQEELPEELRPIIYTVDSVSEAVDLAFQIMTAEKARDKASELSLIGWGSFYMAGEFKAACLRNLGE